MMPIAFLSVGAHLPSTTTATATKGTRQTTATDPRRTRNRNCLLDSIDACAFAHMHMFPKQRAGVSREEYELNVVRHLDKTMLPNIMKKLEDDLRGLSGLSATCLPCKEDTDEAIAAIKVQPKPPQKPKAAVPEGEATAERTANACAFSLFSSPAA